MIAERGLWATSENEVHPDYVQCPECRAYRWNDQHFHSGLNGAFPGPDQNADAERVKESDRFEIDDQSLG
jgi:hypothetical protein